MEYIQDLSLVGILVTSLFMGPEHKSFGFTWAKYNNKQVRLTDMVKEEYNPIFTGFLLQLSLMITESSYLSTSLLLPNFMNSVKRAILSYDNCPHPLISKGLPNISINKPAMVANLFYQDNILLIAFTGTINGCMAALDLSYTQVELNNIRNYIVGCKGHRGIYLIYQSIRDKLIKSIEPLLSNPKLKIIIFGHSLGGGLSQLCTLDLASYDPIHYSFASPKVFNKVGYKLFSTLIKHSYRVTNLSDLIVLTPLSIMPNGDMFYNVGELIYFERNLGTYSLNHTTAYIEEYNDV